jgi:hypothetical protein
MDLVHDGEAALVQPCRAADAHAIARVPVEPHYAFQPRLICRGFEVPAGTYVRDTAFPYRLAAGRIAERWAIRDDLAMLMQLGALRPPG